MCDAPSCQLVVSSNTLTGLVAFLLRNGLFRNNKLLRNRFFPVNDWYCFLTVTTVVKMATTNKPSFQNIFWSKPLLVDGFSNLIFFNYCWILLKCCCLKSCFVDLSGFAPYVTMSNLTDFTVGPSRCKINLCHPEVSIR